MSNERSPRPSCSTTMGTRGMSGTPQPIEDGLPGEAPLPADLAARELARVGQLLHRVLVDPEEHRDLRQGEDVARRGVGGGDEADTADGHVVGLVLDGDPPRAEAEA